ncbi:ecto-ADP-ribosyltransferase 4 [Pleuronectes platessa]|uniref:ecto-ADP-ribosyltransferase 4 n=1 Tax=Pleuronectes platessa TaxID=8262 RepID=UPI00232A1B60|nr:ecto-ADP-ribosyltransferase 4 [Pleuronectes platessa]
MRSVRKWAPLCVLLTLVLMLYHDPYLILWWPQQPAENTKTLPLDMATDAVDDMYGGCRSQAAYLVNLYFTFEWEGNRNFSSARSSAERHAKEPAHEGLRRGHAVALYMFTEGKRTQQEFNTAVRTGKHKYSTRGFKYHYLYFYLTDALQVLHRDQPLCRRAYHRTWRQFNHNVINTDMRFGAFTLASSADQSFDASGNVSCFEIFTCFSADVTYYSATRTEGQILIPPYEVFKITDVLTDDPRCTVVYKLHSTKTPRRDLNCKLNERLTETFSDSTN